MFHTLTAMPLAELPASAQAALRVSYGALLCLQILATLPNARRYFVTERYGGYMESTPLLDRLHTPATALLATLVWLGAALCITFNAFLLPAAAINFLLARYFFVSTRWRSILRGMGAPGHMSHWLAALILFLALAQAVDAGGVLRAMTVLTFRVDFALIMIAAGVYKLACGYGKNHGFQQGLANPWWGFWARWVSAARPFGRTFALLNHAGYAVEVACGALFFVPAAAPYAAILLGLSFLGIALSIRLTFLAEMVAACSFLFFTPGTLPTALLSRIFPTSSAPPAHPSEAASFVAAGLLAAYLAALPLAYAGMCINFYGKRRLWRPLQKALDLWCGFFGLMLWRVFTSDVINFYCTVKAVDAAGHSRNLAPLRAFDRTSGMRFMHVAEFICLASIFTTLKYYPENPRLFESRLLCYARSLPLRPGERALFSYVSIQSPADAAFRYVPIADFWCDPSTGAVREVALDASVDLRKAAAHSPVSQGSVPGSYAPASAT